MEGQQNELAALRCEYTRISAARSVLMNAITDQRAAVQDFKSCIGEDAAEDVELGILIGWSEETLNTAVAAEDALMKRQESVWERVTKIERQMKIDRLVKVHAASMKALLAAIEAADQASKV